ncbi:MAG TPA: hypothetical protein VFJ85_18185 [Acidimicrobiales bacterium]|nr:hypothetical protein [Acidimicrobiales bacterium]
MIRLLVVWVLASVPLSVLIGATIRGLPRPALLLVEVKRPRVPAGRD